MKKIDKIFTDVNIIEKIQNKLPELFQLAEADNSRNGKLGMEIGSTRERIVIALLMYEFGEENVDTDIPITKNETDVIVFDEPISIKTVTGKKIIGVKLIWTVDAQKALDFINYYKPEADMIFVHINWNLSGGMYFITKEAQAEVLAKYNKDGYFKLPKQGTNPRGVEITNDAMNELALHKTTKKIDILWHRDKDMQHAQYQRWIEMWKDDKTS